MQRGVTAGDVLAVLGTLALLGAMVYPLVRDLLQQAPLP